MSRGRVRTYIRISMADRYNDPRGRSSLDLVFSSPLHKFAPVRNATTGLHTVRNLNYLFASCIIRSFTDVSGANFPPPVFLRSLNLKIFFAYFTLSCLLFVLSCYDQCIRFRYWFCRVRFNTLDS